MGLAKEKVEQFKAMRQDAQIVAQESSHRSKATSEGIPLLWEDLQQNIESEVKEFSKDPASPKLVAIRCNENNLTVQTNVFPVVKLEIIRAGMYIQACRTEHHDGLSLRNKTQHPRIRFSVDDRMIPCFTDGDREFSPDSVGDQLLEPVFDFLIKQAMR